MALYTVSNGNAMAAQDVNQVVNLITGADPVNAMVVPGRVSSAYFGAPATTAYAGATASGAPAAGTFNIGDFVIDQTGFLWSCAAGGSPGTWNRQGCSNYTCILTNTGAQTLTSRSGRTGFDVCAVNTATYDPHSMFVSASHEIQVPIAGYWLTYASVGSVLSGNYQQAALIVHNGTEYARGDEYQVTNYGVCKAADVVKCAVNDTIQVGCYANGAAVTTTTGAVRLSAILIA